MRNFSPPCIHVKRISYSISLRCGEWRKVVLHDQVSESETKCDNAEIEDTVLVLWLKGCPIAGGDLSRGARGCSAARGIGRS
jgi:hypothetical protein